MSPICPFCQSDRVRSRDLGKRVGSFVGAVAGAVSGATTVLGSMDARVNPMAHAIGVLAGAVMGCLVGGTAGCATGASFGVYSMKKLWTTFCA